mmetsp:Transcript_51769/g.130906  ORF Transcript_51769/g.130906 Transcript_51769/m.130906 type:complete len:286 (-) Transcript_51769:476-1333(-)
MRSRTRGGQQSLTRRNRNSLSSCQSCRSRPSSDPRRPWPNAGATATTGRSAKAAPRARRSCPSLRTPTQLRRRLTVARIGSTRSIRRSCRPPLPRRLLRLPYPRPRTWQRRPASDWSSNQATPHCASPVPRRRPREVTMRSCIMRSWRKKSRRRTCLSSWLLKSSQVQGPATTSAQAWRAWAITGTAASPGASREPVVQPGQKWCPPPPLPPLPLPLGLLARWSRRSLSVARPRRSHGPLYLPASATSSPPRQRLASVWILRLLTRHWPHRRNLLWSSTRTGRMC